MLSAVLAVQLLLAGTPGQGPQPFRWEVPDMVAKVEVPGRMSVAGMPIRLEAYTSRKSVQQLLQHFATVFDEAGFYIQRQQRQFAAQPHLTALDTKTLIAYTVILEPEPGGLTTVVIGEAKLNESTAPAPAAASSMPVYPGASKPLMGDFEGAKTLAYQVVGKQAQIQDWYREQLTRAGYKEESPLTFRRREQELRVSLSQNGGWVQVVVFLKTTPDALPGAGDTR
ncbi:hypothetical protein [Hyalangium versicolor]|uniref:hypothetical protein n=1 Tax=Hyalangium versicolor TaxID=2861190 RepID=UPI001CCD0204|nr:hypothetical protein [Hyalangium versicolor]